MPYDPKAPAKRKRSGKYLDCEKCGDEFYANPARIRQTVRLGLNIRFCSKACYDSTKFGEGNPFWGKKHTLLSLDRMREHVNRPKFQKGPANPNRRFDASCVARSKRAKFIKETGKCHRCGFKDLRALVIHHKDRNRKNNMLVNLELLCCNCHTIEHYEAGDGWYAKLKQKDYRNAQT